MATYLRGERLEGEQSPLPAHKVGPGDNPSGPAAAGLPLAASQASSVWLRTSTRTTGASRSAASHRIPPATGRARVIPVEPPLLTYAWQRVLGQPSRADGRR
jgi:hypothetical protein